MYTGCGKVECAVPPDWIKETEVWELAVDSISTGKPEMAMERHELHGVKLYQFDICEAICEQDDCPGVTTLKAGDHDLGTVARNCSCHKKPETKYPSNAPYL
jgi:hypothetical protein